MSSLRNIHSLSGIMSSLCDSMFPLRLRELCRRYASPCFPSRSANNGQRKEEAALLRKFKNSPLESKLSQAHFQICIFLFFAYICALLLGELAQLARALALQARGHRFDSDILHKKSCLEKGNFFLFNNSS